MPGAMNRAERIAGGLWGLLVGDAVGVPYEFSSPAELPPRAQLEMFPPPEFRRAHDQVPPGTWSDDGAQALCLLASLLDCGRLDVDDLGRRLVAWHERGVWAVEGVVFDVGVQSGAALRRIKEGVPAHLAGASDEMSNGNGSLMRVLPLALWHQGSDAELVRDAHAQSLPTHGHPRSQACCAYACLWARNLLNEVEAADQVALRSLRHIYGNGPLGNELNAIFPANTPWNGRGTGYAVDCLWSALQVMSVGRYEDVVRSAIALGHDTDTTACVAGGLAGIRDGVGAIPAAWLSQLRGRELVEPLLERLLVG